MKIYQHKLLTNQKEMMNEEQLSKVNNLITSISKDGSIGNPHRLDGRNSGYYEGYYARDFTITDARGPFRLIYKYGFDQNNDKYVKICGISDYHDERWRHWTPSAESFDTTAYYTEQAKSNIIVSADGGRLSTDSKSLTPAGPSTVIFYSADNDEVDDHTGNFVFDSLCDMKKVAEMPSEVIKSGDPTYDYACWKTEALGDDCGIFDGYGERLYDLNAHDERNPLFLSQILEKHPNKNIYWLSGRTVYPVNERDLETSSNFSFTQHVQNAPKTILGKRMYSELLEFEEKNVSGERAELLNRNRSRSDSYGL